FVNRGLTYEDIRPFAPKLIVDRLLAEGRHELPRAPREGTDRGIPGDATRARGGQGPDRPDHGRLPRDRWLEGGVPARRHPRHPDRIPGQGARRLPGIPGLAEFRPPLCRLRRTDRTHGDGEAARGVRGPDPGSRHEHPVRLDPRRAPARRVFSDPRSAVQGEHQLDPARDPRRRHEGAGERGEHEEGRSALPRGPPRLRKGQELTMPREESILLARLVYELAVEFGTVRVTWEDHGPHHIDLEGGWIWKSMEHWEAWQLLASDLDPGFHKALNRYVD